MSEALNFLTEEEARVDREEQEELLAAQKAAEAGAGGATQEDPAAAQAAAEAQAADEAAQARVVEDARQAAEEATRAREEKAQPAENGPEGFIPVIIAEAPQDFDNRLKAIADAKDALLPDYNDGKITLAEMLTQRDELERQRSDLVGQQRDAETAARTNEANARQMWNSNVEMYVSRNQHLEKPTMRGAWDAALKTLIAEGGNEDKSMYWYLDESHKRMLKDLGLSRAAPAAGNPNAGQPPARPRPEAPTTLHAMPAAARTNTGADEFADLDSMSGLEAEMALDQLARRDPQKYERYMQGR